MLAVAALWSRFFLKKAPPQFEKTRLVLAVEGAAAAADVEIGDFNFVLPDESDPPFSVFNSVPVKPYLYTYTLILSSYTITLFSKLQNYTNYKIIQN